MSPRRDITHVTSPIGTYWLSSPLVRCLDCFNENRCYDHLPPRRGFRGTGAGGGGLIHSSFSFDLESFLRKKRDTHVREVCPQQPHSGDPLPSRSSGLVPGWVWPIDPFFDP